MVKPDKFNHYKFCLFYQVQLPGSLLSTPGARGLLGSCTFDRLRRGKKKNPHSATYGKLSLRTSNPRTTQQFI